MKTGRDKSVIDFVERNFEVHGEFEGVVYHEKRNGEQEKYPYQPVSYYQKTALTIRNEVIRRFAAMVSNPRESDYSSVIKKLNYYTPYILPCGQQKFLGETVFYVRERGDYEFRWQGMPMGFVRTVAGRTQVELSFHAEGEFELEIYFQGELYCSRSFIISSGDLEIAYNAWLSANLEHVLSLPEPQYESLKTYRRGMRSKVNWLQALTGKFHEEVVYDIPDYSYKDQKHQNPWLYHRRKYNHAANPQTQYFNNKIIEIGQNWQTLSQNQRDNWNTQAARNKKQKLTGFNLYTRKNVM
ncbi:MAG: hypothetical protein K9M99_03420 [Candidatus Cloacimonetes bacterium]|nr:hypothetical protein [Candidatus Cloacimonadota bacterium]